MDLNLTFLKKIGEGSYGVVYKVKYLDEIYAFKIEKIKGDLNNEIKALEHLSHPSIPQIVIKGVFKEYAFIVMPYFKVSIVQILLYKKDFFTPQVVAAMAWNVLDVLQYIHSQNMVYTDIKPENVMIGSNNKIFLIDFGMCIEEREAVKVKGTLRYLSVNAHKGGKVSFLDDLEGLKYLIIFLLRGSLPWADGLEITKIIEMKMKMKVKGEKWINEGWIQVFEGLEMGQYTKVKELLLSLVNGKVKKINEKMVYSKVNFKWFCCVDRNEQNN